MIIKKILWVIPFLSFLSGYYLVSYFFSINEIEVPNLIGKTLAEASKILSDHNLNLRILTQKEDPDLPDGTILDQNPVKQKIKVNKSIYLVVSKKFVDCKMPEFRGKEFSEIKQFIEKLGIRSKVYYLEGIFKENQCICQFPMPGKLFDKNGKIILYLSSGNSKKPILFPDFRDLNLKEVIDFLSLYNLNANLSFKNSEQYDPNNLYKIVDQRPLSGSLINLSKNINIQLHVEAVDFKKEKKQNK